MVDGVAMKIALHTLKSHPYLLLAMIGCTTLAYAMTLALSLLHKIQG